MQPGSVFAGYQIERRLGRGGMGSVYLAKHPRLPRRTALKLLNPDLFDDKETRARFEREADLAAQLDHPNIVTVYDRGAEDGQLWISMQYIDGVDAASLDPNTLPVLRAVQIIADTAQALDFAHSMGVLHRDVKPANILLSTAHTGPNGSTSPISASPACATTAATSPRPVPSPPPSPTPHPNSSPGHRWITAPISIRWPAACSGC